jgi:excisionase family DNA binding protein
MFHFDRIVPDLVNTNTQQISDFSSHEIPLIPAGGRAVAGSNPVSPTGGKPRSGGVSTIYNLARTGRLPHLKIGRALRFSRSDLEAHLAERCRAHIAARV